MKIRVVGTGYVGLVSGVCLAEKGHDVTCLDVREEVVAALNRGVPHFYEKDLEPLLQVCLKRGAFRAGLITPDSFGGAELVLVAVGTPSTAGTLDLGQIRGAAEIIGDAIRRSSSHLSVVVKSTVLPRTTDTFVREILERRSGRRLGEFGLGMNPEFLREGNAIEDFMQPDRIVLGYEDPATLEKLRALYAPWETIKIEVNTRTAEMIKYANNTLLALQISAANELANIAAASGNIDIMNVMRGVHTDKRWSPRTPSGRIEPDILTYLVPGCGFGGSCLPKDVQALRTYATDVGVKPRILQAILDVNAEQPHQVAGLIIGTLGSCAGKTALILGVAFKPGTDDVRESASLVMARDLVDAGARVVMHDPVANANGRLALKGLDIEFVDDWQSRISGADVVVLATRWDEYRNLEHLAAKLKGKVVFDARRFLDRSRLIDARYLTIGSSEPAAG